MRVGVGSTQIGCLLWSHDRHGRNLVLVAEWCRLSPFDYLRLEQRIGRFPLRILLQRTERGTTYTDDCFRALLCSSALFLRQAEFVIDRICLGLLAFLLWFSEQLRTLGSSPLKAEDIWACILAPTVTGQT